MENQPQVELVSKFLDYLLNNYIDEDALFPPNVWAEHSSSIFRTTNACESFHSFFNSSFYVAHPNFYTFLNVLKNCQIDSYIKQRSCNTVKPIYDKRVIKKIEFIDCKINELKSNILSRFEFVQTVSHEIKHK